MALDTHHNPANSPSSNPIPTTMAHEYRDAEKGSLNGPDHDRTKSGVPGAPGHDTDGDETSSVGVGKQIAMESGNAIQYRTCSWQKTAALLFSEYICLAIMSFPWSYSILGLVPGIILTVVIAALVLYTSLICWQFCIKHPDIRDVCDLGQMIFYNHRWAFWATAVMFILNNTFIQGLHCLVGAKYLNTMTGHSMCTIGFSAIVAVISWICSLPRTFDALAKGAALSAIFTFVSVILAAIFAGIESHPTGYPEKGPLQVFAVPASATPSSARSPCPLSSPR
ncbi:unnamed protein product [Periconia digitata]|uniref:Amino acid transporter transmembrane domain-containing protein n=1 Tax=Periconia digitata TaxID=1303443 RepID=A0A9W4XGS4_9PLEO|nr:unnamed protein product [Periconia digitata]